METSCGRNEPGRHDNAEHRSLPRLAARRAAVELATQTIRVERLGARPDFSFSARYGYRPVVAGVATFAAYALVLKALTIAPAAPVAAVRETSVLFGAALGWFVLKERATGWRVAGVVLVTAGVMLVSI